jgi:Ca2+-binding RTX toxin-like protein
MAQLSVSVPHATITNALLAAAPDDTIVLAAGYGPEVLTVSLSNITLTGPTSVHGIAVFVAASVTNFALLGVASINVTDLGSGVSLTGNMGGNNVIETGDGGANTVTTGAGNVVTQTGSSADTVDAGSGNAILKDSGGAGTLTG